MAPILCSPVEEQIANVKRNERSTKKRARNGRSVLCVDLLSDRRRAERPASELNRTAGRSSRSTRGLTDHQGWVRIELTHAGGTRLRRIVVNGIPCRCGWGGVGHLISAFWDAGGGGIFYSGVNQARIRRRWRSGSLSAGPVGPAIAQRI